MTEQQINGLLKTAEMIKLAVLFVNGSSSERKFFEDYFKEPSDLVHGQTKHDDAVMLVSLLVDKIEEIQDK